MHYLVLDPFENFCTNRTSFGGVILEKPLRSSQKLYFLLLRKPLKTYNFIITNAILMKLTAIVYLNGTFCFPQNWSVTQRT